jgi:hypothetical protein
LISVLIKNYTVDQVVDVVFDKMSEHFECVLKLLSIFSRVARGFRFAEQRCEMELDFKVQAQGI